MAKDAVETMGMLLPDDVEGRDAVHVAVIAAVALEEMYPGDHVAFMENTRGERGAVRGSDKPVGIADPFILDPIPTGARFWLFLYPRTITGLRHWWTHPAFPDGEESGVPALLERPVYSTPAQKLASDRWLREFCRTADCPGYEMVLAAAAKVADGDVCEWGDEFLHFDGDDAHGEIPAEFWDHVEVVLGRPIKGRRASCFSCSC